MKTLILGEEQKIFNLTRGPIGETEFTTVPYDFADDALDDETYELAHSHDVIFDLNFDDDEESAIDWMNELYAGLEGKIVFVSSVKRTLARTLSMTEVAPVCRLFGLNSFNGFLNRPALEVCAWNDAERPAVDALFEGMGMKANWVADRTGMVAPRVLCLIINEAYLLLEQGAAPRADIDAAMKLGVNYPHGPFEWAEIIGLPDVAETLFALQGEKGIERFPIAGALRDAYYREMMRRNTTPQFGG